MKKLYANNDEIIEGETLRRAFAGSIIKSIDKDKRQIEFIISTATVDRYGDVIEVKGWDLKQYKRNPVVLFGHASSIPPIGKALKVWKTDTELRAVAEFMSADLSPFADSIFRMYEEKFLRAVSVGFKPIDWEWIKDDDDEGRSHITGVRFKKQELLEFSAVPIPANPDALIDARKKGISTEPIKEWAESLLDNWDNVKKSIHDLYGLERKKVEQIRKRASGVGSVHHLSLQKQDELLRRNLEAIRKAKAEKMKKAKKEIVVGDFSLSLPITPEKEIEAAGLVEITTEEINGVKNLVIDKAADTTLFSVELLEDKNDDFISLDLKKLGDDEEETLVVTLKGEGGPVSYSILGVDGDEVKRLYGVKLAEAVDNDASSAVEDNDNEDADTADLDSDSAAVETDSGTDDSDDDDDDNVTEESDEKGAGKEVEKELNKESEDTLPELMDGFEQVLCNMEDLLDLGCLNNKKVERRIKRKAEFLASYMRELADRFDGGKAVETKSTPEKTTPPVIEQEEEDDDTLTEEEAKEYTENLISRIQPMLTDMIKERVNKLKGRLD